MVTNNLNQELNESILFEKIEETDKTIKYILNIIMFLGSLGFTITGISSYFNKDIFSFLEVKNIIFFPQGLTMLIYGSLGLIFSINQFKILLLKIGEGYNEFNKINGTMTLFRKGQNNEKSDIKIVYQLSDIVRNLYVCAKRYKNKTLYFMKRYEHKEFKIYPSIN